MPFALRIGVGHVSVGTGGVVNPLRVRRERRAPRLAAAGGECRIRDSRLLIASISLSSLLPVELSASHKG
jgi:hypothetical protein